MPQPASAVEVAPARYRPRILCYTVASGLDTACRIEYRDERGIVRSAVADLDRHDCLVWGHAKPTDDSADDLYDVADACVRAGAEYEVEGVRFDGFERLSDMIDICDRECNVCGARVESENHLSSDGECPKCFVARMGGEAA